MRDERRPILGKIPFRDIVTKTGTIMPGEPLNKIGQSKAEGVITFGKHKGKTYQWVYENDSYWWEWACENINSFREKAEKWIS